MQTLRSMHLLARIASYPASDRGIEVLEPDESNTFHLFAHCCSPQPPEPIVGYRRSDGILMIHRTNCDLLRERERLIPVQWGPPESVSDWVLVLQVPNSPGLRSQLSTLLDELSVDVQDFTISARRDGVLAEVRLVLGRTSVDQAARLQQTLERVAYINSVELVYTTSSPGEAPPPETAQTTPHSNPYSPRWAEGARFYGREEERARLIDLLHSAQCPPILLWGQRRIGKTSLMLHLRERLQGDLLPIYIDVQGMEHINTGRFLYQLLSNIARVLRERLPAEAPEIMPPRYNNFRKDPLVYFDAFLERVQPLIARHPLVLLLDEFQCLQTLRDEEQVGRGAVFSRLRSYSQHMQGFRLVLCGGGLLSRLTHEQDIVPLLGTVRAERIDTLSEQAARKLIKEGLSEVASISHLASDLLLDLTACHPFYLQLLCSRLYEQVQPHHSLITHDVVRESVEAWWNTTDETRFCHFWEGGDQANGQKNKLVLSAIADLKGIKDRVEYERIVEAVRGVIPEHELVGLLEDLHTLGVLTCEHTRYYAIKVRLFAHWLRRHWPLKRTLKESPGL
jgi:hypothetical protein